VNVRHAEQPRAAQWKGWNPEEGMPVACHSSASASTVPGHANVPQLPAHHDRRASDKLPAVDNPLPPRLCYADPVLPRGFQTVVTRAARAPGLPDDPGLEE